MSNRVDTQELWDCLEMAWVVIANVGVHKEGWKGQHPEWVKAAEKWRDDYHKLAKRYQRHVA
jgi:hypothetical protein